MICCWVDDPNSMANQLHLSRIKDYLWVAEDGMKMQGYNGSQLWDVAFAVQAILSTNLVDEHGSMLKKSHEFIKISQVRDDSSGNLSFWYRHISKGGWPFSTPRKWLAYIRLHCRRFKGNTHAIPDAIYPCWRNNSSRSVI